MLAFQTNKLLRQLCTFGIGGPARYYIEVHSTAELAEVLGYCRDEKLPYFVLGKGSNCLFDDKGFNGVVIHNKIDFMKQLDAHSLHVGAGYSFSLLGTQTARKQLTGLEFASGIPGTVGGAVYMNAGANGQETCQVLESVEFLNDSGEFTLFAPKDLSFSYRTSPFQKMKGVIVSASFKLADSPEARQKQLELITYRQQTQPYSEKSAGCIFRNPVANHAGALIDKCGLKGVSVGGAQVSSVHGNFIVNSGEASAQDVQALIALIKERVKTFADIDLHSEVLYIPFEL